ncbi:hypothetical protein BT63DRAFT_481990 [Microthyrium microscopicum]|uniref:Uncharacterized protein n=1 Tax=Microthyrium microscopicum TaxID=703497 RepID=A0A6A6U4Y5_9PEZI|nr:hypothetical protein BT63DRAFT_481990 [Microthyrium microscopicum]
MVKSPSAQGGLVSDFSDEKLVYQVRNPPWTRDFGTLQNKTSIKERVCKIHGVYTMPKGYEFAYVPSDAVINFQADKSMKFEVSASYSFTKAAIAIVQTVYASITLYRARGNQVQVFGYAAFGLTVIPYHMVLTPCENHQAKESTNSSTDWSEKPDANYLGTSQYILMSLLNLLAQLVAVDYPTLYMVRSEMMEEAIRRGGIFKGFTGHLGPDTSGQDANADRVKIKTQPGPWIVEDITENHLVGQTPYFHLKNPNYGASSAQSLQSMVMYKEDLIKKIQPTVLIPSCPRFKTKQKVDDGPTSSWELQPGARNISSSSTLKKSRWLLRIIAPIIFGCLSVGLLGILSKFSKGTESTSVERGFTMSWLAVGMLCGFISPALTESLQDGYGDIFKDSDWFGSAYAFIAVTLVLAAIYGVFLVPGLGGYAVVGKMILKFGSCSRIDDN